MKEMKTELNFSTAFPPLSDGLADASNHMLKQLLQLHCSEGEWIDQLPMLVLLYNATPQSQMSPYFAATGQQPLLPMDLELHDLKVSATEDCLKNI